MEQFQTSQIPINQLVVRRDLWPRFSTDEERIELFADQLRAGEELPPIELVPHNDGKYLIADGVHRTYGAIRAGRSDFSALIVTPLTGETPEACVYRRALETATRSALPLSKAERRRAVLKLRSETDLSDRAIAQLVGVSHNSVGRWTKEASETPASTGSPSGIPTVEKVATRMATYLTQIDGGRGLLDLIAPGRVGKHIAQAFADCHGENALHEIDRVREWIDQAARALRENGFS
jgi:ParB/Sulfiredoxin domain